MRAYSLLYKSLAGLKSFIDNNQILKRKKYLIKIHSSNLSKEEMQPIVNFLTKCLPSSEIFGCSVGGIIYKGKGIPHDTLINFIDCFDTDVRTTSVHLRDDYHQYKPVQQIVDEICWNLGGIDDSFLFAFYSPEYSKPSQIVDEMNRRCQSYRMIGGGSFSIEMDSKTFPAYIIHNNNVMEDVIVVAKLKGHLLLMNQTAVTGIQSIGRTYKVTKSKEHHLIEIENQPAKEWFDHIVGKEYLIKDPHIVDAFPLVRYQNEKMGLNILYDIDPFTNQPLGKDLFVFDEVQENEELITGYIDPIRAMNDAEGLCKAIEMYPAETLFAYSCMTRRNILHNCAQWELQPFDATPITGAFMAGELIWDNKKCGYCNSAFTVASLSEDKFATVNLNVNVLKDCNKIQFDNLPLVNYIFSTANSELKNELKENKKKLTEQLIIDSATGLPNLSKYIYDNESIRYHSACLLSLKNESIVRVFLSKKTFLSYINSMVKGCKQVLDNTYQIYLYNELSILIVNPSNNQEKFCNDMKKLKKTLYQLPYEHYNPVYEMSLVFSDEDLLKKLEITYHDLHKGTKDFIIFSEEDTNKNFNHEIHILQVINDAISYKRIIPYYQGIHNNTTDKIEICESLMRICDQNGSIYMPDDFLPIAKEYKLYDRLSKMMIEVVFADAEKRDFAVTINLNVQDIYNYDILQLIFNNLEKSKKPDKFIFEIVEGEEITDYDYLREFTNKIHSLGGKIAIDDFGTGYSNLLHVLRIDIDYLKITGEIIKEICNDDSCQEFVGMISAWASHRGKNVIAEYVENKSIQKKLMEYKVAYSQGYLFSKPHQLDIE